MTNLTPETVIQAGREAYRMTHGMGVNYILRQVAIDLDLEGEDYEDLVLHLVTADEIDEEAYRWVTQPSKKAETFRSTVPEGYGGGWSGQTF